MHTVPAKHIGEVYGDLTIIGTAPRKGKNNAICWLCRCVCGVEKSVTTYELGVRTISCGCGKGRRLIEINTTHGKSYTPEYRLLTKAKERAVADNLPYDLELEDAVIPDVCPILGIPLKVNTGGKVVTNNSPTIDKRDPSLGYTKDNSYVISMLANRLKSNNNNPSYVRAIADYVDDSFQGFGQKPLVDKYLPKKKRLPYPYFNPVV